MAVDAEPRSGRGAAQRPAIDDLTGRRKNAGQSESRHKNVGCTLRGTLHNGDKPLERSLGKGRGERAGPCPRRDAKRSLEPEPRTGASNRSRGKADREHRGRNIAYFSERPR
jgi:hypothetical protein